MSPAPSMTGPTYPYPGVRVAGLFLVIVGTAIVVGGLLGGQYLQTLFWIGFGGGFVAMGVFARPLRRPFGPYTRVQVASIPSAIVLEILLILAAVYLFQDQLAHGQARGFILAILLAVGIHFVPFAISSGPLMLLLAVLCCANATVGFLVTAAPLVALWIVDGVLKIAVGIALLRTPAPVLPAPAPQVAA
jgi:hypothetical protein